MFGRPNTAPEASCDEKPERSRNNWHLEACGNLPRWGEGFGTVGRMGKLLLAAGAAAIVLTLTGCIEPAPHVTAPPTPSATPVFASDEEALAAAEEAYAAYTVVEDQIARDGGSQPERLESLVTPEWYKHEAASFETFRVSGNRQLGSTSIRSTELQQVFPLPEGGASVVIYVCVDFSGTSFVDADGNTLDRAGPVTATFQVTFEAPEDVLLLSGSEPWSESIC